MTSDWTKQGGSQWGRSVQYANGDKHDWAIKQMGERRFLLAVNLPKGVGVFHAKKTFDTLRSAERYADRFIERADGWQWLERALPKDFQKAAGPEHVRPSDLKPGLEIIAIDNPEWGTWRVLRKYDERIWEVRGRRGDRVLNEDELRFWRKA